jgi:hypothetical protein
VLSHGGGLRGPLWFERVSISGVHQLNYPGSEPRTGEFVGRPLYTADGSAFLIDGQRGFALIGNNGALLRQISFPPSSICRIGHWWSDQVVQGVCSLVPRDGSSVYGPENLVLINIGSGQIRQITKAPPPEYGYDIAWPYSGGILAQRATSCGSGSLDTIRDNGTVRPFDYRLPAGASGQAGLVNVFADRATLITGDCGNRSRSLIGLNLRTGATTVLLGPGLNGGTVLD